MTDNQRSYFLSKTPTELVETIGDLMEDYERMTKTIRESEHENINGNKFLPDQKELF